MRMSGQEAPAGWFLSSHLDFLTGFLISQPRTSIWLVDCSSADLSACIESVFLISQWWMNAPPVDITCTACSPQEPTALIFNSQNCLKLRHALKTKGSSRQHQRILTWKSPFSFLDISGKTTTVYTSLMVFLREPPWVLCCFEPEEHVGCLGCLFWDYYQYCCVKSF